MQQMTATDPITLSGYQLRLASFEGPLDVLLRLIERDQLDITTVSLIAVTDQFLAYLTATPDLPPALVAEFAAVAGRLVLLKSRSLLPRPAAADEPEPEELVQQLIEYRALRAAVDHLAGRDRHDSGAFARGDAFARPQSPPPRLVGPEVNALARALRRRLTVVPTPATDLATRPLVTLREMTERLLGALGTRQPLRFSWLRATCTSRHEVLVAFLAVLVLDRRRIVEACQEEVFGEITISRRAGAESGRLPLIDAGAEQLAE